MPRPTPARGRSTPSPRSARPASSGLTGKSATPRPRRRLPPEEREQHIAEHAVRYFAEVGFDADTRALAREMGVTQSLIFRYFPTKEALVDRVYREVYVGRWKPAWEALIADRSRPLPERLKELYVDYSHTALTRDWVRIFMFSGLKGHDINARYLTTLRRRVLEPVAAEVRAYLGLPGPDQVPLLEEEVELVWSINARVFYYGQRSWIFDVPARVDVDRLVELTIDSFVEASKVVVPRLVLPGLVDRRPRRSRKLLSK
jgi:AcrR family transcriptional regulator